MAVYELKHLKQTIENMNGALRNAQEQDKTDLIKHILRERYILHQYVLDMERQAVEEAHDRHFDKYRTEMLASQMKGLHESPEVLRGEKTYEEMSFQEEQNFVFGNHILESYKAEDLEWGDLHIPSKDAYTEPQEYAYSPIYASVRSEVDKRVEQDPNAQNTRYLKREMSYLRRYLDHDYAHQPPVDYNEMRESYFEQDYEAKKEALYKYAVKGEEVDRELDPETLAQIKGIRNLKGVPGVKNRMLNKILKDMKTNHQMGAGEVDMIKEAMAGELDNFRPDEARDFYDLSEDKFKSHYDTVKAHRVTHDLEIKERPDLEEDVLPELSVHLGSQEAFDYYLEAQETPLTSYMRDPKSKELRRIDLTKDGMAVTQGQFTVSMDTEEAYAHLSKTTQRHFAKDDDLYQKATVQDVLHYANFDQMNGVPVNFDYYLKSSYNPEFEDLINHKPERAQPEYTYEDYVSPHDRDYAHDFVYQTTPDEYDPGYPTNEEKKTLAEKLKGMRQQAQKSFGEKRPIGAAMDIAFGDVDEEADKAAIAAVEKEEAKALEEAKKQAKLDELANFEKLSKASKNLYYREGYDGPVTFAEDEQVEPEEPEFHRDDAYNYEEDFSYYAEEDYDEPIYQGYDPEEEFEMAEDDIPEGALDPDEEFELPDDAFENAFDYSDEEFEDEFEYEGDDFDFSEFEPEPPPFDGYEEPGFGETSFDDEEFILDEEELELFEQTFEDIGGPPTDREPSRSYDEPEFDL